LKIAILSVSAKKNSINDPRCKVGPKVWSWSLSEKVCPPLGVKVRLYVQSCLLILLYICMQWQKRIDMYKIQFP
jgi:hypothetical protein